MKIPKSFSFIFLISFFIISCVNKKAILRETNSYSTEELIVIEFATRMEEQEYKFKDFHKL
jgi:hypothetical protein